MANKYRIFTESTALAKLPFDYEKDETAALKKLSASKTELDDALLNRIKLWKIGRTLDISDSVYKKLERLRNKNELEIDSPLSKEVMEALVDQHGVGYPLASAFMKFLRPEIFPIIDVRAYRASYGITLDQYSYSWNMYVDYTKRLKWIHGLPSHHKLKFEQIDERLYSLDKIRYAELSSREKSVLKITASQRKELKGSDSE